MLTRAASWAKACADGLPYPPARGGKEGPTSFCFPGRPSVTQVLRIKKRPFLPTRAAAAPWYMAVTSGRLPVSQGRVRDRKDAQLHAQNKCRPELSAPSCLKPLPGAPASLQPAEMQQMLAVT